MRNGRNAPFVGQTKSPLDELIDLLLQLPDYLAIFDELELADTIFDDLLDLRQCLCARADAILKQLFDFQHKFACHMKTDGSDDSFDPSFTAYYHSAAMICLRYYSVASRTRYIHATQLNLHAETILHCCTMLNVQGVCSRGSYIMVYALKVVSMMATSWEIRKLAQDIIREWESEREVEDPFTVRLQFNSTSSINVRHGADFSCT